MKDENRVAGPKDYERIVAIVDDWWGRPISDKLPRLYLGHFWSTSRVAEDASGLAGFLVGFVSPSQPGVAYAHFVAVRPDRRRTGLARALYREFEEVVAALGCVEVHAITGPGNTDSIRFHRRIGFAVSAPVVGYNGPGRPMVTFRKALECSA
jgi:GNAT superfamily N-acetyltransferase